MVVFVAMIVLVAVGVLLWKAMAAQALAASSSASDDAPTGPTRAATGPGRPRRQRPVAPDDDPEFLRRLDDQLRRSDRDDPPAA